MLTNIKAPNGLAVNGNAIREDIITTGSVFYVSSDTGSDSYKGISAKQPVATIDKALALCTADKGDVVYVMPGHTETVSAASGLNIDVAGVSVIGLGNGSLRPTITLDTADTATVALTAANVLLKNFIFTANFADIVSCIITSAANITIEGCLFNEKAAAMNYFTCISTDAVANSSDGLKIINNTRISIDAAALAFISILEDQTDVAILGNYDNQASAANVGHFLILGALTVLGLNCQNNILNLNGDNNAQTVGVFATGSATDCTGVMAYNLVNQLDATTELFDTATLDFGHFQNFMTGVIAKSGYVLPAIDS